tara:strand:+ start:24005 stop:25738 length:1734 start_codon:yes stop_codon:yes gene_type:complete
MAWSTWLRDKFLGFTIQKQDKQIASFAPPEPDDGAINMEIGGAYGTYVDFDGKIHNEVALIDKYREMSITPECDEAIEDIVNEAIVMGDAVPPVELELSTLNISKKLKQSIYEEFKHIYNLLNFDKKGHEIFRKWYVDGKTHYHMMIDEEDKDAGIQELRYLDSRKIRKVREIIREQADNGVDMVKKTIEFYAYDEVGINDQSQTMTGLKINPDVVAASNSGLYDHKSGSIISYLHKAIKPLNQLKMMEDAIVIYRIARAPERRIFYIDVGNLPKAKAEQYLRDMMVKHRNKIVYDASTGEIKDDRKHMNMMEDYWLPRREGGRGTEIQTLPGGQNLGELEDIEYFQRKLYKALNVPTSRLMEETGFSLGRETEITRDELKFSKFIMRLRTQFVEVFDTILKTQLILKGIIKDEEWGEIKDGMEYMWAEDGYYREIKNTEMLRDRLSLAQDVSEYTGKFFSIDYIRREVLKQTQEEMDRMDREIEAEKQKEIDLAKLQGLMPDEGGGYSYEQKGNTEVQGTVENILNHLQRQEQEQKIVELEESLEVSNAIEHVNGHKEELVGTITPIDEEECEIKI